MRVNALTSRASRTNKSQPNPTITCDSRDFLDMGNPFETYNDEDERFLSKAAHEH